MEDSADHSAAQAMTNPATARIVPADSLHLGVGITQVEDTSLARVSDLLRPELKDRVIVERVQVWAGEW
jgi:hypothetical protein